MSEFSRQGQDIAPLSHLFPIQSLVVNLKFTKDTTTRFFHQPALSALLRHLAEAGEDFSRFFCIDSVESGRTYYRQGDTYRFTLFIFGRNKSWLDRVFSGLASLPHSAPNTGRKDAFSNNLSCLGFQDGFTEETIHNPFELAEYSFEQLAQESALWEAYHESLTLTWLSPVRLLKNKADREGSKGEARYCAASPDIDPSLLLARLYDSVNGLLRERGQPTMAKRPPPPSIVTKSKHCFWIDASYRDNRAKDHTMGGMLGTLTLESSVPIKTPWIQLLVLGQYLGVGQRRSFGFGRYQLSNSNNEVTARRTLAAKSILARSMAEPALIDALSEIQRNSKSARDEIKYKYEQPFSELPESEETPITDELPEDLRQRAEDLMAGAYKIPALHGVLIPKADGTQRALAVPPILDRVLQRSCAQELSMNLDRVMEESSHGYRKGRSRHGATIEIQQAYRKGARWVVEADIDNFFDEVNHKCVEKRLRSLFHQDPIIPVVLDWISAAVNYKGVQTDRTKGLPQGAPISPLIANLLLDDFDADMRKTGIHCVRYADDFVLLCQTENDAQKALIKAKRSISELGFELDRKKTRITPFEKGFRFLGYLFVNDMALDVGSKYLPSIQKESPQKSGWYKSYSEQAAQKEQPTDKLIDIAASELPIGIGAREEDGTFVCLSGASMLINTRAGRMRAERNDEIILNIPWSGIRCILSLGNHHFTTPAMQTAMEHQIPIHMATAGGKYLGLTSNNHPQRGANLWLLQEQRSRDPEIRLVVAKELVTARVRHQQEILRQRTWKGGEKLGKCLSQLNKAQTLESVMGIEGLAAKHYFEIIASNLDSKWDFKKRNRRPPRDPFNALLSLGYTILYAYCDSALRADGLLPWTGFYHQARGKHSALASDMMEPFRHIIERCALTLLNTNRLKPDDFISNKEGCHLNKQSRKLFISELSSRLDQKISSRKGLPGNLIQHLSRQNKSLVKLIRGQGTFEAWRQR